MEKELKCEVCKGTAQISIVYGICDICTGKERRKETDISIVEIFIKAYPYDMNLQKLLIRMEKEK